MQLAAVPVPTTVVGVEVSTSCAGSVQVAAGGGTPAASKPAWKRLLAVPDPEPDPPEPPPGAVPGEEPLQAAARTIGQKRSREAFIYSNLSCVRRG